MKTQADPVRLQLVAIRSYFRVHRLRGWGFYDIAEYRTGRGTREMWLSRN